MCIYVYNIIFFYNTIIMYLVLHNTALVLPINYREMSLFSQRNTRVSDMSELEIM